MHDFLQAPKLHDCREEENALPARNHLAEMQDFFHSIETIHHGNQRLKISQEANPDSC